MKESTHSLWAWLDQPEERKKCLNPLYSPNPLVIWPSVEPQSIQLWQGMAGAALGLSEPIWVACSSSTRLSLLQQDTAELTQPLVP